MREIKFRAWDKVDKYMMYDVYMRRVNMDFIDFKRSHEGLRWTINIECKDIVLMQYTGLKDKNGKEIYEGDIVKMIATILEYSLDSLGGEVEEEIKIEYIGEIKIWASMGVVMKIFSKNGGLLPNTENNIKNVRKYRSERIGNKFENPELLEMENG